MPSVFIIENDLTLQLLYEKILENNGFQVIAKESLGVNAIVKFRLLSKKPDVILMDYRMPIMNGIETTKEILDIDNNAKVILISGDNAIESEALKYGVKMFLKKPFNYYELIHGINSLLNYSFNVPEVSP